MKLIRLISYGLLVVASTVWIPTGIQAEEKHAEPPGPSGSVPPCSCDKQDRIDMENRLKQIENAFKAIDWLIKQWQGEETARGGEVTMDETIYESVRNTINREMSRDVNPHARLAKAKFVDFMCEIKSVEGPPCLKAAVLQHEQHHQEVCKTKLPGYRFRQRVVDYLKEERHGYEIEKQYYERELTRLKSICPDPDASERQRQEALRAMKERMERAEYRMNLLGNALDHMGP
jgi:hypothetical protein